MNLRENKMDQYKEKPKKKFFWGPKNDSQKKLQKAPEISRIEAPEPHAALAPAPEMPPKNWKRKPEKGEHKPQEKPDYQRNYHFEEEHSPYLKEHPENVLVQWRGPEFEHYPHDRQWYMGALVVLCLIIVYAIFTDSIIMAIVFVLIAFTGYLHLSRPQKVIDFAVTYDGIVAGSDLYRYDDIVSFWIFYEPPHTRIISLHMKGHFRPYLHIPLHQVDPVIIHKQMTKFLPEIRQEQNLVDTFERLLRM